MDTIEEDIIRIKSLCDQTLLTLNRPDSVPQKFVLQQEMKEIILAASKLNDYLYR